MHDSRSLVLVRRWKVDDDSAIEGCDAATVTAEELNAFLFGQALPQCARVDSSSVTRSSAKPVQPAKEPAKEPAKKEVKGRGRGGGRGGGRGRGNRRGGPRARLIDDDDDDEEEDEEEEEEEEEGEEEAHSHSVRNALRTHIAAGDRLLKTSSSGKSATKDELTAWCTAARWEHGMAGDGRPELGSTTFTRVKNACGFSDPLPDGAMLPPKAKSGASNRKVGSGRPKGALLPPGAPPVAANLPPANLPGASLPPAAAAPPPFGQHGAGAGDHPDLAFLADKLKESEDRNTQLVRT